MKKSTFITFGLLVFVLAVVIPWLAFRGSGDANTGAQKVPAHLKAGQALFETNCGTCHTLYAAGTDGNYGPTSTNSSPRPARPNRARPAKNGQIDCRTRPQRAEGRRRFPVPGRMPPAILNPDQQKEVAEFVGAVAGEG